MIDITGKWVYKSFRSAMRDIDDIVHSVELTPIEKHNVLISLRQNLEQKIEQLQTEILEEVTE